MWTISHRKVFLSRSFMFLMVFVYFQEVTASMVSGSSAEKVIADSTGTMMSPETLTLLVSTGNTIGMTTGVTTSSTVATGEIPETQILTSTDKISKDMTSINASEIISTTEQIRNSFMQQTFPTQTTILDLLTSDTSVLGINTDTWLYSSETVLTADTNSLLLEPVSTGTISKTQALTSASIISLDMTSIDASKSMSSDETITTTKQTINSLPQQTHINTPHTTITETDTDTGEYSVYSTINTATDADSIMSIISHIQTIAETSIIKHVTPEGITETDKTAGSTVSNTETLALSSTDITLTATNNIIDSISTTEISTNIESVSVKAARNTSTVASTNTETIVSTRIIKDTTVSVSTKADTITNTLDSTHPERSSLSPASFITITATNAITSSVREQETITIVNAETVVSTLTEASAATTLPDDTNTDNDILTDITKPETINVYTTETNTSLKMSDITMTTIPSDKVEDTLGMITSTAYTGIYSLTTQISINDPVTIMDTESLHTSIPAVTSSSTLTSINDSNTIIATESMHTSIPALTSSSTLTSINDSNKIIATESIHTSMTAITSFSNLTSINDSNKIIATESMHTSIPAVTSSSTLTSINDSTTIIATESIHTSMTALTSSSTRTSINDSNTIIATESMHTSMTALTSSSNLTSINDSNTIIATELMHTSIQALKNSLNPTSINDSNTFIATESMHISIPALTSSSNLTSINDLNTIIATESIHTSMTALTSSSNLTSIHDSNTVIATESMHISIPAVTSSSTLTSINDLNTIIATESIHTSMTALTSSSNLTSINDSNTIIATKSMHTSIPALTSSSTLTSINDSNTIIATESMHISMTALTSSSTLTSINDSNTIIATESIHTSMTALTSSSTLTSINDSNTIIATESMHTSIQALTSSLNPTSINDSNTFIATESMHISIPALTSSSTRTSINDSNTIIATESMHTSMTALTSSSNLTSINDSNTIIATESMHTSIQALTSSLNPTSINDSNTFIATESMHISIPALTSSSTRTSINDSNTIIATESMYTSMTALTSSSNLTSINDSNTIIATKSMHTSIPALTSSSTLTSINDSNTIIATEPIHTSMTALTSFSNLTSINDSNIIIATESMHTSIPALTSSSNLTSINDSNIIIATELMHTSMTALTSSPNLTSINDSNTNIDTELNYTSFSLSHMLFTPTNINNVSTLDVTSSLPLSDADIMASTLVSSKEWKLSDTVIMTSTLISLEEWKLSDTVIMTSTLISSEEWKLSDTVIMTSTLISSEEWKLSTESFTYPYSDVWGACVSSNSLSYLQLASVTSPYFVSSECRRILHPTSSFKPTSISQAWTSSQSVYSHETLKLDPTYLSSSFPVITDPMSPLAIDPISILSVLTTDTKSTLSEFATDPMSTISGLVTDPMSTLLDLATDPVSTLSARISTLSILGDSEKTSLSKSTSAPKNLHVATLMSTTVPTPAHTILSVTGSQILLSDARISVIELTTSYDNTGDGSKETTALAATPALVLSGSISSSPTTDGHSLTLSLAAMSNNSTYDIATTTIEATTELPLETVNVSMLSLVPGMSSPLVLEPGNALNISVRYNISIEKYAKLALSGSLASGYCIVGTLDEESKTGFIVINSSVLNYNFGNYSFLISLVTSKGANMSLNVFILHEEKVQNLQVFTDSFYVVVGQPFTLNATLSSGSNVQLQWITDNLSCIYSYVGNLRQANLSVIFETASTHTILVSAWNDISSASRKINMTSQYEVSGFRIQTTRSDFRLADGAKFILYLDPTANLSMGNIVLEINYGDGYSDSISLLSAMDALKKYGFNITHKYSLQENYTVKSRVYAEINSLLLEDQQVAIWDQLNVSLVPNTTVAMVDESIYFSFIDPPKSGLFYNVSFGDASATLAAETSLNDLVTPSKVTHAYSSPGLFNYQFFAWNPFYTRNNSVSFTIQYPLKDSNIELYSSSSSVPFPTAYISLNLTLVSGPPPTDVQCTFDSGETVSQNISTTLQTAQPIVKNYTYLKRGLKHVVISCHNLVSSVNKTTIISVIDVPLEIKTGKGTIGRLQEMLFTIRLNNTFNLSVNGVQFYLEFGDGNNMTFPLHANESDIRGNGLQVFHAYDTQDNYTVKSKIFSGSNQLTLDTLVAYVWDELNVTLSANKLHAATLESIDFTFMNPPISGFQYEIIYGDGTSDVSDVGILQQIYTEKLINHKYVSPRIYTVVMHGYNPFYSKSNSFQIVVQNPIPNISLSTNEWKVPHPGASVNLTLTMLENKPSPTNVTCLFDYGDNITEEESTTILYDSPIVKEHTYKTPGDKFVIFTCSNAINSITVTTNISVFNFAVMFTIPNTPIHANMDVEMTLRINEKYLNFGNVKIEINFGDGKNKTIMIEDVKNTNNGYIVSHQYKRQGNYTLKSRVYDVEAIDLENKEVYIWDKVNTTVEASTSYAKVNEIVNFKFTNPSQNGFRYMATYSNGFVATNDDSVYYKLFKDPFLNTSYNDAGIYEVVITAWNPFYFSRCKLIITVQYPIPSNMSLLPLSDEIPIPGSDITFIMEVLSYVISPTNVSCTFDFGETMEENLPTNLTYGAPIIKHYEYQENGTKNVNFSCYNLVSSSELLSVIIVRSFTLSDFKIHYQDRWNMNMTEKDGEIFPSKNETVNFKISLFQCSKLPPNITFQWNFGDGGIEDAYSLVSFYKNHTYRERGNFTITIGMESPNETYQYQSKIQMGIVQFYQNSFYGIINFTRFQFGAVGLEPIGNYEFHQGHTDIAITKSNIDVAEVTFTYDTIGEYFPYVIATNETFYEKVYFPKPVKVDHSIKEMNATLSNYSILLPPGEINITVFLPVTSSAETLLTCEISMGDDIDKKIYLEQHNISHWDSYVFTYRYLTMGKHRINLRCSNLIETFWMNETEVYVFNPCFVERGMFDRQYSNCSNPLRLYTSNDADLSSRMPVKCVERDPEYIWEIYEVQEIKDCVIREPMIQYPVYGKPTGKFRFRKGTMKYGVYKVSLMVDLKDTWAIEFTYVMFERTAPFAMIEGGYKKSAERKTLILDALSESYNPEEGYGSHKGLNFSWSCFKYNESNMGGESLDQIYLNRGGFDYFINASFFNNNFTHEEDMECGSEGSGSLKPESHSSGKATLQAGNFDFDYYIVCIEVTLEFANASYFCQRIEIVPGERPEVKIRCKVNCREKIAVLSKLSVEGICNNCTDFEYLLNDFSWTWIMKKWNGISKRYQEISNLHELSETGKKTAPFILRANSLSPGQTYLLKVTLSMPRTRKDSGWAEMLINSNYLPYGGTCSVQPNTGKALTTVFKVECNGWKDEGTRQDKNSVKDGNEPLTYEYVLEKQIEFNNKDIIENIPLFFGGESSASELLLAVGDEKFDYTINISVKVTDMFGDYSVDRISNIKVIPDTKMQIKSLGDVEAYQNIMDTYNSTFPQLKASGNIIAVIRYVGATASLIIKVNTSSSNNSNVIYDMRNKTRDFLLVFYEAVTSWNDTRLVLNAGDSNNVMQNVKACMKNEDLVNSETTDLAIQTVNNLTHNMASRSFHEPYPTEDMQNINQSSEAALDIIDAAIDSGIPNEMEDVSKELTLQDIEDYLKFTGNITEDNSTSFDDVIQAEYNRRMANREVIKQKLEYGNSTMSSLVSAVLNLLEVQGATILTNEPERVLERDNLRLTMEKESMNSFVNQTVIDKNYMKIEFNNDTNTTDNIILRTAVFKKPPHFYGDGADKLTSRAVLINLINGTKTENVSLTVNIVNEAKTSFRRYQPKYIPGDPEKRLYYKMKLRDTNDATIVYIKPDGSDQSNFAQFGLYDVFMTSEEDRFQTGSENVFKYEMNVRDWESSATGFKVFIPEGTLSAGDAYIVLKPLKAPEQADISQGNRRKRSVENANDNSTTPIFEPAETNFSLIIMTTGCKTWCEEENAWVSRGCTVLSFSTLNETACRCPEPQGQMFATTFYVPPNFIDLSGVWAKFDASNAAVYGTIIALFCLYILGCLWARRKDKQDRLLWTTHFLCDSDKEDDYFYLITVSTGMNRGAGTDSSVHFVLGGDAEDSGVRILSDGINKEFASASERKFFMGTHQSLGDLHYLRIWLDYSDTDTKRSWFLKHIMIDDLQTTKRYVFICDRWLAENQDDGQIERHLTVMNEDELARFHNLFSHHARFNLAENHLWLSLILRPNKSSFNRVQRLSCILALLLLTMISNAMFYRPDEGVNADTITLGSMKFSLQSLYVSFVGLLLTAIPIFLVTLIFRNSRQKELKNKEMPRKVTVENSTVKTKSLKLSDDTFYYADRYLLPHWASYIACVITFFAIVVPAFFLILYSMEWGKDKTEAWLAAFTLSFVESLVVIDPVKVLLIAVIMALLLKKSTYRPEQNVKLVEVKEASLLFDGGNARRYRTFRRDILTESRTASEDKIRLQKLRRQQEIKAQEAMVEIILYIVFGFIVYSIGYINRDERMFLLKNNIYSSLHESNKYHFGFNKVKSYDGYIKWLQDTFFPRYLPVSDYSGTALDVRDQMFFYDLDNARIGRARLRQIRTKKVDCPYSSLTGNRYCVPDYHVADEEDGIFCSSWMPYNQSCVDDTYSAISDAWRFRHAKEIWGLTMVGDYGTYDGGGFIVELDNKLEVSNNILKEINNKKWIDRRTRAVFLEFTLYNANTNLFAYAVFLAEFTVFGGIVTWTDIQSFRPYQHTGAMGVYAILCYLAYIVVLTIGTIKVAVKLKELGYQYFTNSWRLIDILSICLSFVGVSMWILRFYYAQQSISVYFDNKDTFINFQHIVVWDYVFNIIVGILIFISTVRLLRILGYNKRMTQIASVVTGAGKELLGFSVVFGIVFFAYVLLGYLIFGIHMREYRSLFTTLGSLANALIGKNSLDAMAEVVPEISQVYYFTYVFFVILTLMTMFAAILNQSISEVREEAQKEPEVFGVMDILKNTFKDVFGPFFPKRADRVRKVKNSSEKYIITQKEKFDAPNILRLVRDVFGEKATDKEFSVDDVKKASKDIETDMLYLPVQKSDKFIKSAAYDDLYLQSGITTNKDTYTGTNHQEPVREMRPLDTRTPYLSYL